MLLPRHGPAWKLPLARRPPRWDPQRGRSRAFGHPLGDRTKEPGHVRGSPLGLAGHLDSGVRSTSPRPPPEARARRWACQQRVDVCGHRQRRDPDAGGDPGPCGDPSSRRVNAGDHQIRRREAAHRLVPPRLPELFWPERLEHPGGVFSGQRKRAAIACRLAAHSECGGVAGCGVPSPCVAGADQDDGRRRVADTAAPRRAAAPRPRRVRRHRHRQQGQHVLRRERDPAPALPDAARAPRAGSRRRRGRLCADRPRAAGHHARRRADQRSCVPSGRLGVLPAARPARVLGARCRVPRARVGQAHVARHDARRRQGRALQPHVAAQRDPGGPPDSPAAAVQHERGRAAAARELAAARVLRVDRRRWEMRPVRRSDAARPVPAHRR
mmetsp:Transcript_99/g.361  ORF Transcript_99/g.361 Transcript_99/m.361 type:complete len:384 (-) Transcript_99:520-1671(-)